MRKREVSSRAMRPDPVRPQEADHMIVHLPRLNARRLPSKLILRCHSAPVRRPRPRFNSDELDSGRAAPQKRPPEVILGRSPLTSGQLSEGLGRLEEAFGAQNSSRIGVSRPRGAGRGPGDDPRGPPDGVREPLERSRPPPEAGRGPGALSAAPGRPTGTFRGLPMRDFWWKIVIRDSRHCQFQGSGTGKGPPEGNLGLCETRPGIAAKKIEVEK